MYCIIHEMFGEMEVESLEGKLCFWVTCPPPEIPKDWELHLTEPSPSEMAQINLNAQELELELA